MKEVPPGKPGGHDLHRPHQRGGLPVAFGAEAVAVGHQPLHGQAGQLLQAVQVLEGVGEGLEAAVFQKARRPSSIAGRFAQRLALRRRRAAAIGPRS